MAANGGAQDELNSVLTHHRDELMAADSIESDLDFAFHLQLQEALTASLALHTSTPQPPPPQIAEPPPPKDTIFSISAQELSKFEQESLDHKQFVMETQRVKEDLHRRVHDEKFARFIDRMPEDDWEEWGENLERPFGEGCSREMESEEEDEEFRVYFKGMVSNERINNQDVVLAGIGVAICDFRDNLILEIQKPLIGNGMNKQMAEIKALIEGLNAALSLELKRVQFYCDFYPIFQFISKRWPAKQRKIATLVNQVWILQRKFTYCEPQFIARNDVKYAFKLAREAILSQINKPVESNIRMSVKENCVICLEDNDLERMFAVDGCQHRYCFSCVKQHVEVKLLNGMVPKCPHDGCKSNLTVESCQKFLVPKMIETLKHRIKEASIPVNEKVYCPYPRCSALMSRSELFEFDKNAGGSRGSGARKCIKCHGLFCVNCKVPWHSAMSCNDYKRLHPNPPAEDLKLKSLATRNMWRQCVKCNHMIELIEGCWHMTCRCGYEFCYSCGAEWKDKKATCSCPAWEEDHIWHENHLDSDDEDEYEDDYYDSEDEDEDEYFSFFR